MSMTDYRVVRREQDREDRRLAEEARLKREEQERQERLERERLANEKDLERERLKQEAEDRRREQERLDREQKARERREREERDRQAKLALAKERKKEKARRAKERRERWTRRIRAVPGWVGRELDFAAAVLVMAASILPALIAQSFALRKAGLADAVGPLGTVMLILLPVMLEVSAWAAVAGEQKAMQAGRSATAYRIAVWSFASFAAAVNFYFGMITGGSYGTVLGAVLAASSIVPVTIWQLVQLGRHAEQRRKIRDARRSRKERRERERATEKARQHHYPEVWQTALRLRAIGGHERLSMEDAWHAAWAVHEGAGESDLDADLMVLLSADLLALRADAEERLAAVLTELRTVRARRLRVSTITAMNPPESVHNRVSKVSTGGGIIPPTHPLHRVRHRAAERTRRSGSSQVGTSNPASAPARDTRTKQSPTTPAKDAEKAPEKVSLKVATNGRANRIRKGRGPQSDAAKTAARDTAKKASAGVAKAEKTALETWAADQIRETGDVAWQDIRDEALRRRKETDKKATAPSRSWCYARRTAAIESGAAPRPAKAVA